MAPKTDCDYSAAEGLLTFSSALQKSRSRVSSKTPSLLHLALPKAVPLINVACDLYSGQMFYEIRYALYWSWINLVQKHYIFLGGSMLVLHHCLSALILPIPQGGFVVLGLVPHPVPITEGTTSRTAGGGGGGGGLLLLASCSCPPHPSNASAPSPW